MNNSVGAASGVELSAGAAETNGRPPRDRLRRQHSGWPGRPAPGLRSTGGNLAATLAPAPGHGQPRGGAAAAGVNDNAPAPRKVDAPSQRLDALAFVGQVGLVVLCQAHSVAAAAQHRAAVARVRGVQGSAWGRSGWGVRGAGAGAYCVGLGECREGEGCLAGARRARVSRAVRAGSPDGAVPAGSS